MKPSRKHGGVVAVLMASSLLFAQQQTASLTITTESLPRPLLHQPYQVQLTVEGGSPPLRWTVSAGKLPDGLDLSSAGVIEGTPEKLGDFDFTIAVSDSAGHTVQRDFTLKPAAPLLIEWSKYPRVEGDQITGSVKVSNGTPESFDLTVIILGVNEYHKAFALGYERFTLQPDTEEMEIPFGSTLPQGTYEVHADAIAEIAAGKVIFRDRRQTEKALQVTSGP